MHVTLSHYRILEQIGAGGMGVVYRAHDEHLDCDVALKVLPPGKLTDEATRKRFRKEALALSKISHPNIAVVHDFDTQDGIDFLVEELIPGLSLSEMLISGPLPEREIVTLGSQLAEGLHAAHQQGVIHRDLKPANIRVTPDGRLKVLDFGLARIVQPSSPTAVTASETQAPSFAGTLPYMAPEQLLAEKVDPRTDIWALGCVLYETATGRPPFLGSVPALIDAILHQPAPAASRLNPRLSPGLEAVILKCLDKNPDNRYQSAKELAVDLRRLTLPSGLSASGHLTATSSRRRRIARSAAYGTGGVLVLALAMLTANVGGWRARFLAPVPSAKIHSVAVLPLANLSNDASQEYFVDGLTEMLISTLSRISSLRVISRTSVMHYKGVNKPLPEIARELNVDSVLEGAVLRSGDRVRVAAQLVRASDDSNLWGATYDRDLRDVLALQSEIAQSVADDVRVKLSPQEQRTLSTRPVISAEGHDAYLKGRYYWNQRTAQSLERALRYFQEVVAREPRWALGYVGLADCYNLLPYYADRPLKPMLLKAKEAAQKAIALDDEVAEAHASLSYALMYGDWDLPSAEQELKRAITLNPNYATGRLWYAGFLMRTGQLPRALDEIRRAQQLDPLSPFVVSQVGFVLYYMRQSSAALAQLKQALELDPDYWVIHMDFGLVYEQQGNFEAALRELHKAVLLSKSNSETVAALGHAYAAAGQKEKALQQLLELNRQGRHGYVLPYLRAVVYAGLGDKDNAFKELGKSYANHDDLFDLSVDPWFDNLRNDPRYSALLDQIGLLKWDRVR